MKQQHLAPSPAKKTHRHHRPPSLWHLLLAERLHFHLQVLPAAFQLVDLLRLRAELHADLRARLRSREMGGARPPSFDVGLAKIKSLNGKK